MEMTGKGSKIPRIIRISVESKRKRDCEDINDNSKDTDVELERTKQWNKMKTSTKVNHCLQDKSAVLKDTRVKKRKMHSQKEMQEATSKKVNNVHQIKGKDEELDENVRDEEGALLAADHGNKAVKRKLEDGDGER
ncbi:uncharacterized protein G2W53_041068 [Senna tora]|uniref:Uncharacterized protein n=1 Tax=Senna tora TaxID=362788 RepID=A0A834SES1_9FABA|nr:uncharacterized protein G2W53_041068 [Senna tora]